MDEVIPKPERCNGKDDDCDGKVDEMCVTTVYSFPSEQNGLFSMGCDKNNTLYLSRPDSGSIDVFDPKTKSFSRYAGGGNDPQGTTRLQISLLRPRGIAFDAKNYMMVAEEGSHAIRLIDASSGAVSNYVGVHEKFGDKDGGSGVALLEDPGFIIADQRRGFYILNHATPSGILKIVDSKRKVTTLIHKIGPPIPGKFPPPQLPAMSHMTFFYPHLWIVQGEVVMRADVVKKTFTIVAGAFGSAGFKDGKGGQAHFDDLSSVVVSKLEKVYVTDSINGVVRTVDANGNVATVAGQPKKFGIRDEIGSEALFKSLYTSTLLTTNFISMTLKAENPAKCYLTERSTKSEEKKRLLLC